MRKTWLIVFMIMLLCSACGTDSIGKNDTPNSDIENADSQIEETTQTETEEPEPVVTEILISAVGDCTLGTNQKQSYNNSFHEYFDTYGDAYFLQHVKHIFEADDFTIVNLEGTLTNSNNMMPDKLWNHKGRPEYVTALTKASVEAVTLGNNHIMDYEEEGVADTIATVEQAGITYALSGDWGNHLGLYEVKGIKIGFVSVNEHYDEKRVYPWFEEGIKELRAQGADIVIAAPHWGEDKTHVIEQDQIDLGRWCIDQGYDVVLGCHPHVLQGIEIYKDKYIVYSMGNFCYGGNKNPLEKESMIFQITFTFVDGVLQAQAPGKVIPCRLSSVTDKNDYCPITLELDGDEAQSVFDNLTHYSEQFGTVIDEAGNIK